MKEPSTTLELFQLYIERNFCPRDPDLRIRYIPENVRVNPHVPGNDFLQNSMLGAVKYMHGIQQRQVNTIITKHLKENVLPSNPFSFCVAYSKRSMTSSAFGNEKTKSATFARRTGKTRKQKGRKRKSRSAPVERRKRGVS